MVTLAVFHFEMSVLKTKDFKNVPPMLVTSEVSHFDRSELNRAHMNAVGMKDAEMKDAEIKKV